MRKIIFLLLFFMYGCACAKDRGRQIYVPNVDTAIAIAEAIAIPIYGRDTVNAIRPFSAKLTDEIWVVKGQLTGNRVKGGLLVIKLSKFDGAVIDVYHED